MDRSQCIRILAFQVAPFFRYGSHFSGPESSGDVALNGGAANPGLLPLWYSHNPGVEKLLAEWVRAWIEDAMRTEQGKPAGFVPSSIRFNNERFGGYADNWWQTLDRASKTELDSQLISFSDRNKNIGARFWRFRPGEYSIILLQGHTGIRNKRFIFSERGQRIVNKRPTLQLARLSIRQLKVAPSHPVLQFDLALGPDAIETIQPPIVERTGILRLTVHNIGNAAATNILGDLFDGPDRIASVNWGTLDAWKSDLSPSSLEKQQKNRFDRALVL
jgi:hypothetical protein